MNIQQLEDQDYETNASYDYAREAYAGLSEDPTTLRYEAECCAREWDAEMTAAFGPRVLDVVDTDIPF